MKGHVTRRHFGSTIGSGVLAAFALGGACHRAREPRQADDGRLRAHPRANVETAAWGESALGLDRARDAILHLPATPTRDPLPLLVLFHGAGESAESVLRRLGPAPDEAGVAVLAPHSRDSTWDALRGSFGRDAEFVSRSLELVFDVVAVDPKRIAVGGFSDGATYALSLGLINGDLFRRVVAFSPGFVVDRTPHGTPRFFISHGTADQILPIDRCSRLIVAGLQRRGYDVTFREFEGGHEVPADIARDGMRWVAGASAA
jgi:phospholipase/carboxylesterase